MTSRIEFDPQLCETRAAALGLEQRNLVLAFLPYLGAPLAGSDVSEEARERVDAALTALEKPLGPWELVWGPGVFQVLPGAVAANTMFVVRQKQTGELFISIAGTNPFSAYAWLAEDFDVDETRAWVYGEAAEGVATSKGTLTGLRALQGMVPPPRVPGKNQTLVEFLEEHLAQEGERVDVTVSGHSLGGVLSPTLALWLLDTQKEWDHHTRAILSVYAYAGPTPGNDEFARYIDGRFGDRLHRIFNSFDVATRAWNVNALAEAKALYTPQIRRNALWDRAADFAITLTNGIDYQQIDRNAKPLPGKVKEEIVWGWLPTLVNLVGQVLYQHTLAYFELLGVAYPEKQSAVGRMLAHETDTIAREILKRIGVGPFFARALGAGLRLFAELYSRIPFAPSPLAGAVAPEAGRKR